MCILKRYLAALIDHAIGCLIGTILGKIVYVFLPKENIAIIVFFCTYFLYFFFRDLIFWNASIGKKILRIKITRSDKGIITLNTHFKRIIALTLFPLESFLIFYNNNKRLGDIWAKTQIVENERQENENTGDGSIVVPKNKTE